MSLKRKAVDTPLDSASKKPKANASITSFFGQPRVAASRSAPTSSQPTSSPVQAKAQFQAEPELEPVKFDKEAWLAKLTPDQKELLKLEIDTLHETWLAALKDDLTTKSFLDLKRFLKTEAESGKKIFPPSADVYSW